LSDNLFDLTGKVAVITGSSRGIGRAIAEEYAAHGARIVISSRKRDACDAVTEAINQRHGAGTAISAPASISSKAELEGMIVAAFDAFGQIDVLVCNAASNPYYGSMDGISDDQFAKILSNNIISNHWLIQLVLPGMRERRDGSIIVVSSAAGSRARR
jgi:NAD(P)-dependent dehydrogenase (short-subunit alcohol dehydrogenase family)